MCSSDLMREQGTAPSGSGEKCACACHDNVGMTKPLHECCVRCRPTGKDSLQVAAPSVPSAERGCQIAAVGCGYDIRPCGNPLPCADHDPQRTYFPAHLPAPASEPIHKRVYEYDGAFWCHGCNQQWGALPGNPQEPPTCSPAPASEPTEQGGWDHMPFWMAEDNLTPAVEPGEGERTAMCERCRDLWERHADESTATPPREAGERRED
jgi:hypothetical protein